MRRQHKRKWKKVARIRDQAPNRDYHLDLITSRKGFSERFRRRQIGSIWLVISFCCIAWLGILLRGRTWSQVQCDEKENT